MNVNESCSLIGLTIQFPNGRKAKVFSLLSDKGKSCVAYNGESSARIVMERNMARSV